MAYAPEQIESRIVLDETDWLVRFGVLQIALEDGVTCWNSPDNEYRYLLISPVDPYEGIPVYDALHDTLATIPDPEYLSESEGMINPGNWVINRSLRSEVEGARSHRIIRAVGVRSEIVSLAVKSFVIDEKNMSVRIIEGNGISDHSTETRTHPTFRDVSELCLALDCLKQQLSI